MGLNPGKIKRGLIEYIFCCWVCNWRESFSATRKIEAIKIARQNGWFLKDEKWRCVTHNLNPPNKRFQPTAYRGNIQPESPAE